MRVLAVSWLLWQHFSYFPAVSGPAEWSRRQSVAEFRTREACEVALKARQDEMARAHPEHRGLEGYVVWPDGDGRFSVLLVCVPAATAPR